MYFILFIEVNSTWDAKSESVVLSPFVYISIAVATEGGLIAPVFQDADKKDITAINTTAYNASDIFYPICGY